MLAQKMFSDLTLKLLIYAWCSYSSLNLKESDRNIISQSFVGLLLCENKYGQVILSTDLACFPLVCKVTKLRLFEMQP